MNALPKLTDTVLQLTGLNATLLLAHKVRSDTGSCGGESHEGADRSGTENPPPSRNQDGSLKICWGLTFCRN